MSRPGDQDQSPREDVADTQISAKRRQLLRAAVTSAPFALTLPSGAAVANTSAYQCISQSRKRYGEQTPPLASNVASDKWERRIVPEYQFSINYDDGSGGTGTFTVSRYKDSNLTNYYAFTGTELVENNLGNDGDPVPSGQLTYDNIPTGASNFTVNGTPTGPIDPPDNPVYAIAVFPVNSSDTDADIVPIVYPDPQINDYTVFGDATGTQTPLEGSCYCSINPCATNP